MYLLIALCVAVFAVVDATAARWGKQLLNPEIQSFNWNLGLVLMFAPVGYLLFSYLAGRTSLGEMGTYINAGVVLTAILIGALLFGERPDLRTWSGFLVVMIGLYLIATGEVDAPT